MLRTALAEMPVQIRDFPADLFSGKDVPPPRLRRRVGRSSARSEYFAVGEQAIRVIAAALARVRFAESRLRILDFGCGCGRVARFFPREFPDAQITGIDVDADATAWCAGHLNGRFETAGLLPPTRLPSSSFDLVVAVSMFTHFDEPAQDAWLEELARVLRPGGLLIATTHSPLLTFERPDLTLEQHQTLARTGFLFAGSPGRFNEQSAFHAPEYLRTHWAAWFELVDYTSHGLGGYQDLSVFRRRVEKMPTVGRTSPPSDT